MDDHEAFARITALIQEEPDPTEYDRTLKWINRSVALIENLQIAAEKFSLAQALTAANAGKTHSAILLCSNMLGRQLARLELRLPVQAQGAFIGVGNALDALVSISRVIQEATKSVRIVDPYMDETVLTNFAVTADENILIELMSDVAKIRPALAAYIPAWRKQYKENRIVDLRLAAAKVLHDRLIVIDGTVVYTVTQSLKDIAVRSPASIIRVDTETAALKISAYEAIWADAQVVP